MRVRVVINGAVKLELAAETSDERHVIEILKNKICTTTTVTKENAFELTFSEVLPGPEKR